MWLLLLVVAVFLASPFFELGFAFLGRTLSPRGRSAPLAWSVWPTQGEVVSTLTPTLRWPGTGAPEYQVKLFQEGDNGDLAWFYSLVTDENRWIIPSDILLEDETYFWMVSSISPETREPLFSGKFSTATTTVGGILSVTPAAYQVNLDSMVDGLTVQVDVEPGGSVSMVLPPLLTAGGASLIHMEGSFAVRVRPSVGFATLPMAGMREDGSLGEIVVTSGLDTVRVPVFVDVSTMGGMLRSVRSGFDPVLDTPSFSNFADGVLARVTRGTCLGMVLAAETAYEHCRSCRKSGDCRCARLRLRSLLSGEELKGEMNFLHLANLNPRNLTLAVHSLVGRDGQFDVAAEMLSSLRSGEVVPLAIVPADRADEGGMGHAVLTYAAHEFEDRYIFYVYDPDQVRERGSPLGTFLSVARSGRYAGEVLLSGPEGLETIEAYTLPHPTTLLSLSPAVSSVFSSVDTSLAGVFGAPAH